MADTCDNLPINVVGPFEQTLFLGCSIQSVSTSLGWNEQQSTLTVTLVEDDCPADPQKPKVYYPSPGLKYSWHDPDPGFTSPTIGAPVYFRIGSDPAWIVNKNDRAEGDGFEFAGVIQSWTKDYSPNGNPVYTVQIVDPRMMLQNLEVIISDYAGSVYGGSGPAIYNLVNAYGWLEYYAGTYCPQTLVLGANFGSPANGFGGSLNNNEGTPWHELRSAIQYLLSGRTGKPVGQGIAHPEGRFSPYGYAKFRGADSDHSLEDGGDFVQTNNSSESEDRHGLQGFGLLPYDDVNWGLLNDDDGSGTNRNAHGNPYVADYIVDIREIPFTPRWYRLAGPSMNLLDIISQICGEAGADYYVELIVSPVGQKIIKIRAAKRAIQPEVGGVNGIEQFVEDAQNVTSKNISRELRNEPTSVFVYGGYVQTVYQQVNEQGIVQYWGRDSEGVIQQHCRIGYCGAGPPAYNARENGDWTVELDVRPLNLNLTNPLPQNKYWVSETEIRLALGDYDAWHNYVLIYNGGVGTPMGADMKLTHGAKQNIEFPDGLLGAGLGAPAMAAVLENLLAGGFAVKFAPQDPGGDKDQDLKKIHEFVQNWSDTYYGKQFLVQLPYVCYTDEPDSMQRLFSDNPTNDGGYPPEDACRVLDLCWQEGATPTPLDHFSDESNKILPFARYYKSDTGAFPKEGDYIVATPGGCLGSYGMGACAAPTSANLSMYVKGTVEEDPIEYNTSWGTYATALFKVDNPIEVSGDKTNLDQQYAGTKEIAFGEMGPGGSAGMSLSEVETLDFGVRFNPDGGRGDTAMSIAPRRRQPNAVAVPMKSNTTRYGPLSWAGPPGPVTFSADDGLVPWEYGGYGSVPYVTRMYGAMVETVRDSLSFMQVGERGSVNFPGYPTRRLGQELRSSQKMMENLLVEDEVFTLIKGASATLRKITSAAAGKSYWDSSFGPNITNISINIGDDGYTTNYTLSTFSPSFGRFAKYNANKLKQTGQQRAEIMRMQREHHKLRRALASAQGRAAAQMKALKGRSPTKQAPEGAASVMAGTNEDKGDLSSGGAAGKSKIPNTASMTTRTLMFGKTDGDYVKWTNQGFASVDSLYRAVSNDGSNDTILPRYSSKNPHVNDSCPSIPHTTRQMEPPWNSSMAGKSYVPAIIDTDYLDPWSYPGKSKHQKGGGGSNVPDMSIASHGAAAVVKANLHEYVAAGNNYPEQLRVIANKGPLLLHGWGFDIDGKPIPNYADSEAAAKAGNFASAGLEDYFLDNYLAKPQTWPVGPVDLRWDRKRAVWTTPAEFRMIHASNPNEAIPRGGDSQSCCQANPGVTYNAIGNAVTCEDYFIGVSNPEFQPEIPINSTFYAYYDTTDCTYYAIWPSGSGGGSGASGVDIKETTYCDQSAVITNCTNVECINFSQGLYIETIEDGVGTVVADHRIKDTPTCGKGSDVPDYQFFHKINFNEGLWLEDEGDCEYSINADHNITDVGNSAVQDEFFTLLTFGSGLDVTDDGNCEYTIDACITASNLSCASAASKDFCDKSGLGDPDGCIENLVVGPGLDIYKINSEVPEKGSHYIESNLKVASGCTYVGSPQAPTYAYNIETIDLGCGLSGTPITECGGTGMCDINISVNPLACMGSTQYVRYVHDICCSGAGLQVIYRQLGFSSCGLFTGVLGDDECSY